MADKNKQTIDEILVLVDSLFEQNKALEVEGVLLEALKDAEADNDLWKKLHILNEMIGYYRQLSYKDKMLQIIINAIDTVESMDIKDTVPYATTYLNAANGYRSIGELKISTDYYSIAEEIYEKNLDDKDMLKANLYNNMSLLLQEKQDYVQAEYYLKKALEIVELNGAGFEIAVTYANLANTAVLAKDYDKAREYSLMAIDKFEKRNTIDPHYCAALSALGLSYYNEKEFVKAAEIFERAMNIIEDSVGQNSQYYRLKENYDMCIRMSDEQNRALNESEINILEGLGLQLSRNFYEEYGKPMIANQFSDYQDRIAVGLVGEGSDCFGFDDEISRDHDWGPGFVMWVSDETYEAIGERLVKAYDELPIGYQGYKRSPLVNGQNRRGVIKISDFYKNLIGTDNYDEIDWKNISAYSLAAATNGEVFVDAEGIFSAMREKLMQGYPEDIKYLMVAQNAAMFSQTGQYNYRRMLERGDKVTAGIMLSDSIRYAMKLEHLIKNVYAPHDKWLYKSLSKLVKTVDESIVIKYIDDITKSIDSDLSDDKIVEDIEKLGEYFAKELYDEGYISDIDPYLDHHTDELLKKSAYVRLSHEELVNQVVKLEFKAFDEVKNEGGRAYCQNDWPTFSIMRKSQYLTWNKDMLCQYLYDFSREYELGHNLITEKYGRMMESTAPEKYEEIKEHFPVLSEQKKAIIEQIVAVQMSMAEEFAEKYPAVADNARSLHTYEDSIVNTSYETYLRGEISTYSDKMLQLYATYVVEHARANVNIAKEIIENTAKLYGYATLEELH